MTRIAFLIDLIYSPNAGTEKQLLGILERLDRTRFEPHLLVLRDSDWLREAELPCPVTVLGFDSFYRLDFIKAGRLFKDYCRKNDIDLVQTFFHDSNILGTIWCKKLEGIKVIASRRSLGRGYWHTWKEIKIVRYLRHRTDHYIANSRACGDEAIEIELVPAQKVSVIPNGLEISRYSYPGVDRVREIRSQWGFDDEHVVIGSAANLRPIKNLPFLIEAAAEIIAEQPQARFVVLGEGDRREELEHLIVGKHLEGKFVLPGRSTNVAEELYGCDIAVLCSKSESLSNALMEFMAASRPCVASDVGGNGELLCRPEIGTVYPPSDRDRFVAELRRLIGDPEARLSLGEAARLHAETTFSWPSVMEQFQSLFEKLAAVRTK